MIRRLFLAAPIAALPAAASAFRLETLSGDAAEAYGTGCRRADLHDGLAAELRSLTAGAPLPGELAARLDRLRACPFCGCALADGRTDHGEDRPRG
jgi:hypothetical protein